MIILIIHKHEYPLTTNQREHSTSKISDHVTAPRQGGAADQAVSAVTRAQRPPLARHLGVPQPLEQLLSPADTVQSVRRRW